MPLAQFNGVERGHMLRVGLHRVVRNLHIEIALALIVVAQILGAFVEQVLVNRTLLINRYQFLQLAAADLCPFHLNQDHRSLVGEKGIVQPVGRRYVFLRGKTDGGG